MSMFDYSARQVKKLMPIVRKIEAKRETMMKMTDDQLRQNTETFKEQLKNGVRSDKILVDAFATVREASRRVLGLEPYPVQLLGGILLFQGRIAEMATGEGKTLVAAMPSYLMGLTGKGVHVVTVNDYLASRDVAEIGQIHKFLGLTVGCVVSGMNNDQRREAYACDITYVTNTELGFDYLRDNTAKSKEERVLRGLHYAIIDEVDSILIDEARTPLIISGVIKGSQELYMKAEVCVRKMHAGKSEDLTSVDFAMGKTLNEEGDYIVDKKGMMVHLTEQGTRKVEEFFGLENFADVENMDVQHHIQMALRAKSLFKKDVDYVVNENGVEIVDENTGRILSGRRYNDGLHQAIEAKEGVKIQDESATFASVTFQNFFNLYERKSGMTGTAMTEAAELRAIYNLQPVAVPTNKPVIRKDEHDIVYQTNDAKYKAVIAAIKEAHAKRQPVLVGTTTIDVSEHLSDLLKQDGIEHKVLNAKQSAYEAEIIAQAGVAGSVTIATNMAGRGTDIKLDDDARTAGGLFVIGTERHESRRIDNQLRGRSGRQGDPGRSQFYLSLEDNLLSKFMSAPVLAQLQALNMDADQPIQALMLSKAIEGAQKTVEGDNFAVRKATLDYDEVNHAQREWVYNTRNAILDGESMAEAVLDVTDDVLESLVDIYCMDDDYKKWDMNGFNKALIDLCPQVHEFNLEKKVSRHEMKETLGKLAKQLLAMKTLELGAERMVDVQRYVILQALDYRWMQQMNDLELLRESISMVSFGQKDPVVEYKERAFQLFGQMQADINVTVVRMMMRARVVKPASEIEVKQVSSEADDDDPIIVKTKTEDDRVI